MYMQATILTKKRFDNLKPYELPNNVFNTEARLYVLKTKEKWKNVNKLLKKFYVRNGAIFSNKLYTINSLIDNKEKIDIDEIVFPDSLAIVDREVVGFIMPLIESINLDTILKDINIDNETKIKYLKDIGRILEKMKQVRTHTSITDFYVNDLHESNFIVDKSTKELLLVDIDSCKINNNKPFGSRYLSAFAPINRINKYEKNPDGTSDGFIEPSEDTDLYCYIIIILNFLFGKNINNYSIDDIYDFINYLDDIGVNKELLFIIEKVFTNCKNENPYQLLDTLIPYIGKSKAYTHIKNKSR